MAKVEMEVASEVECVVCGAKKFSMFTPYVCHRCWKNGDAAKLIVLLRESGLTQRVPDALARCKKCNALIETTVHCDNCGTFEPTRR